MINVLVPIVENAVEFAAFAKKYAKKDVKFYVGIKENLKNDFNIKSVNVEVHYFSEKSNKEEIVNALHGIELTKGKVLIARRPLSDFEFSKLTQSEAGIAVLKAKHNKFVSKLKTFAMSVIRKCFAFTYFEDISAICYDEDLFELLSVCPNLSMASRINKYVGVEIEEIVAENKPVKRDYNKTKNILNMVLGCLVFVLSIVGGAFLFALVERMATVFIVMIISWWFIAFAVFNIALINFTRTLSVGELRFGRAEEIVVEKKSKKKGE